MMAPMSAPAMEIALTSAAVREIALTITRAYRVTLSMRVRITAEAADAM